MKKIWAAILEEDILEGFPGTTHSLLGESDVVIHQFKIGGDPWVKIYQSSYDEEYNCVCLNDDDKQLRGLYEVLKKIYEK